MSVCISSYVIVKPARTHTGRAMFAKRDGMQVADHAVEEMLAGAAESCVLMCVDVWDGRQAGGVLSRSL